MLDTLAISGYRCLRELVIPLGPLNIVTGANGSGKSSLYRAVRLLAEIAQGGAVASLAREGGLASVLWAGPESIASSVRRGEHPVQGTLRKRTVRLMLGFASSEFGYAIDLGLPPPSLSAFGQDPQIKLECVWGGTAVMRPSAILVERRGSVVQARDDAGDRMVVSKDLAAFDSMMTHCADPRATPELLELREAMRRWRFYDHFRTDSQAPVRQPQLGTHTPVLGHDGSDLAAALQTIREIGDPQALDDALDDAFPGSRVDVEAKDGRFAVTMHQPGLLRPLAAAELSDGTLRYLLWIAALLTPRPPRFMVLNEPETSLHPDLLPALGRLIAKVAKRTQILVVSHAPRLIAALEEDRDCHGIVLVKELGETLIAGLAPLERPAWHWPAR